MGFDNAELKYYNHPKFMSQSLGERLGRLFRREKQPLATQDVLPSPTAIETKPNYPDTIRVIADRLKRASTDPEAFAEEIPQAYKALLKIYVDGVARAYMEAADQGLNWEGQINLFENRRKDDGLSILEGGDIQVDRQTGQVNLRDTYSSSGTHLPAQHIAHEMEGRVNYDDAGSPYGGVLSGVTYQVTENEFLDGGSHRTSHESLALSFNEQGGFVSFYFSQSYPSEVGLPSVEVHVKAQGSS